LRRFYSQIPAESTAEDYRHVTRRQFTREFKLAAVRWLEQIAEVESESIQVVHAIS
jgi:hypothetical protein